MLRRSAGFIFLIVAFLVAVPVLSGPPEDVRLFDGADSSSFADCYTTQALGVLHTACFYEDASALYSWLDQTTGLRATLWSTYNESTGSRSAMWTIPSEWDWSQIVSPHYSVADDCPGGDSHFIGPRRPCSMCSLEYMDCFTCVINNYLGREESDQLEECWKSFLAPRNDPQ